LADASIARSRPIDRVRLSRSALNGGWRRRACAPFAADRQSFLSPRRSAFGVKRHIPRAFHWLSIVALALGAACAAVVLVDVLRHPQRMAVTNVTWPVCALFGIALMLWAVSDTGGSRRTSREQGGPVKTPASPSGLSNTCSHTGVMQTFGLARRARRRTNLVSLIY
jgi:hypothetical protein